MSNNRSYYTLLKENEHLKKLLRERYQFDVEDFEFHMRQERIQQLEQLPLKDDNERIIWDISELTQIKVEDIMGNSRVNEIITARFACFYALKKIKMLSLAQIGRMFNRHHTTVINGILRFEERAEFRQNIEYKLIKEIQTLC